MHCPSWQAVAFLALLALAAAAAPVSAQGQPVAAITPQLDLLKVGDAPRTVSWTVANNGQPLPVALGQAEPTATLALAVPDGWTAALAPGDAGFALPAGATRTINVVVKVENAAPGDGTGLQAVAPSDGDLVLAMTLTDAAGRSSQASAPITLSFLPPPPPIVTKDHTKAIVTAGAATLAVLGVALVLVVYLRRAGQVALHVEPEQRPITVGTDGIFLVQVENRSRVRREVEVAVDGLPDTWFGAFSFPKVQLAPRERSPVPLCIKVPPGTPDGLQAELTLRARPSGRFPWMVQAKTRIEAHDRVRIGNPAPPPQPAP